MKRNNAKRVLALVLASAMLLQQGSVGIFAAETETVTEAQTEQTTEAKVEETQAPATEAPAPETKAEETQVPATEAPAEETKAEETQAPATEATEAPTEETKIEETQAPTTEAPTGETETQAPATEAPGEGTETEETQAPATEAPAETATEAPTEAVTEAPTEKETETESETEEAVVLDTVITQEVFQKTVEDTVQPMIKYTVKVANKAKTADAEDVSVKVLLAKALSYSREDGETAELGVYEKLEDAVNADVFQDIELGEAVKDAYAEGGVVLWKDQKIAAGEGREFVFFATVEDGVADTEALRNLWFVNDEEITGNGKIEWLNTDLLKVEKELPTEFIYDDGNMVVTATLSDGAILPEGAQFVVTEKTLSEEEAALIEESLGEEQTMTGYVAYDMHFEVDGKEVEPENGTVSVSVSYEKAQALAPVNEGEKAVQEDSEVKMLHITDEQTVEDVTTDVDVKKNGKVREVGFTTDGFSTFVLMSSNEVMPIADDTNIYVKEIEVGTHSYQDVHIDKATGMYTGNFEGNTESNRYTVYLGKTVEFWAKVPDGYAFTGKDVVGGVDSENGRLTAVFTPTTTDDYTITLSKDSDKKDIFVKVINPIYVNTEFNPTRHMDELHEYLLGSQDQVIFAPEKNSSGNLVPLYCKNYYYKDPNPVEGEASKDISQQYVIDAGDTITLTAVGANGDSFIINNDFSGNDFNLGEVTLVESKNGRDFGNGLVEKIATFKVEHKGITGELNANETPTVSISFGNATFYIQIYHPAKAETTYSNGYANHFDIEIADGGSFTVTTQQKKGSTTQTIVTTYDTYVCGVQECDIYKDEKGEEKLWTIPAGQYYEKNADPDSTQYELTSAYTTEDGKVVDDKNNVVENEGDFWQHVAKREIQRSSVKRVDFILEIYLKPRSQTIDNKPVAAPQNTITVKDVKVTMGPQEIKDAFNKCPQHNGLDFTIRKDVGKKIKFAAVTLEAEKILKDDELIANDFQFNLYDGNNVSSFEEAKSKLLDTASNDEEGKISFKEISYGSDDVGTSESKKTYTYYIEEVKGDKKDIIYDTRIVKATVDVWADGEGVVNVEVSYEYLEEGTGQWIKIKSDAPTFVNYKPTPEKTETIPNEGEGKMVEIGQEITYEITWKNYRDEEAEVFVTDVLDPGVDFVSADPIATSSENHTVKWNLGKKKAGESGKVTLKVKVNENAFKNYQYDEDSDTPTDKGGKDHQVVNRAGVQVGNDSKVLTKIIPNSVPEKEETDPGKDELVGIGQEISYKIHWRNGHEDPADVTITDKLDPGVDFESADHEGNHDEATHTVTWVLKAQPGGAEGDVELKVRVNKDARFTWDYTNGAGVGEDGKILNQAGVKVGNDEEVKTEIIPNPVDKGPEKTETKPGDRVMVGIGEEITYKITWKNYQDAEADVMITDKLDPGVEFVSASGEREDAGKYDAESHTVTWTLKKRAANAESFVELTVKTTEKAFEGWKYVDEPSQDGDEFEAVTGKDYEVWNRAAVKVGNDPKVYTNIVENPVPEKTEPKPGAGKMVGIGEEVTYEIAWKNGHGEPAIVVVTDALDKGVDFVSASGEDKEAGNYDNVSHTVTWMISAGAGESGKVTLKVKVNERAFENWQYDEASKTPSDKGGKDHQILNRAGVKVGNDAEVLTEIIPNPVPEKTETDPGAGKTVALGQEITYKIHWKNDHEDPADVTITDKLDPGVDFVSADYKGSYSKADHVVIWVLEAQAAGAEGDVELKVKVNKDAKLTWDYTNGSGAGEDGKILNQAGVQVNNDDEVKTNIIPNPVDKGPEKTETKPGDRVMVGIGEEITYKITWKNYQDAEADVMITDKLDPGVEFVSASGEREYAGKYDAESHTVTWTLKKRAANAESFVELTVKTMEKAFEGWKYVDELSQDGDEFEAVTGKDYEVWNRAAVKVGNDPKVYTNIVENPVPEKDEVTPGKGVMTEVGKDITYEIHWKNGHDEPATVTITDKLDPGVTFKSADNGGTCENGVVTWTLNAAAGEAGSVKLTVTVNENAYDTWQYGSGDKPTAGEGKDYEVLNRATVQVGHDPAVMTEIIPNPVPEKDEVTPGKGVMVEIGQDITYEIHWKNGHDEPATVKITDKLDPGVTFKSADNGGTCKDGVVTWTLDAAAAGKAGSEGSVKLTVTVNENAYKTYTYGDSDTLTAGDGKDYEVLNRAAVQVGHDPKVLTNIIPNPVPEKDEVTPGKGVMTEVGKDITYEIHWKNGHDEPATVTVTDKLDPGVTFKSADNNGTCKDGVVTWTLNAAAGEAGSVKLTVTVNENAYDTWQYGSGDKPTAGDGKDYEVLNRAGVQVGADPKVLTNVIPNPVPEKAEVTPGKGVMVGIGQDITYEIHWKNGHDEPATVTVTDKLDPGVTFKSADNGGTCKDGVVTWMLDAAAAGEAGSEGSVKLTVTVNENAYKTYTYGDNDTPTAGDGKDYEVLNRAGVQVGHDPKVLTNIIPNPVPEKEETDPGANETVYVGDQITYEIHWKNGHDTAADVTVTDPLDEGLDFVSADQGGSYDSATRTVTWVIKNVAAGQSGKVTLVTKVNVNARKDDYIVENQAGVQVGNDPKVLTQIIPNPTPEEPRDGTIRVTKELTALGEDLYAADETFYVALFADEACTKRVTDIKALEFKNASSSTVTFKDIDIGRTYYVGEVNADGEVILAGLAEDGTIFTANFNEGKSAVVKNADGSTTVVFENTFENIPDGFYRSGKLNITKKLLGVDGKAMDSDETFYAGIFADAEHTELSGDVSENIVELSLSGGSSVSASVDVVCDPEGPTTLYVTEVTEDGRPVGKSFGYTVTVDNGEVSLDVDHTSADVTITNRLKEEPESESEEPTKSVKTGDDTPLMSYVLLILAALAMAIVAETMRRRRRIER